METSLTIFDGEGKINSKSVVEKKHGRITTGLRYSLREALGNLDWQRFITAKSDAIEGNLYDVTARLDYKDSDYYAKVTLTHDAIFNMSGWRTEEELIWCISENLHDALLSNILKDMQEAK